MAHYPTSTQRSKWTFTAATLAEKHDANNRRAVMTVREHYRAAVADGQGATGPDTRGGGGDHAAPDRCVPESRGVGELGFGALALAAGATAPETQRELHPPPEPYPSGFPAGCRQ